MRTLLVATLLLAACGPVTEPADCELLTQMWRDLDGDGFGGGAPQTMCFGTPGWVTNGLDCADEDPRAFPGQTAWQNIPIDGPVKNGLAWDFDCDGQVAVRWRSVGVCMETGSSCYINPPTFPAADGFWLDQSSPANTPPPCGATGTWVNGCRAFGSVCIKDFTPRVQACL